MATPKERRGTGTPRSTLSERFWSRVDRRGPDECWPWLGAKTARGYGQIYVHGRSVQYAHRISLELATGKPVPADLVTMHSCDNPPCANPRHLCAAKQLANLEDCVAKGRANHAHGNRRRGEASHHATITEAQALDIKRRLRAGERAASIARSHSVARSVAYGIKYGNSWRHVA